MDEIARVVYSERYQSLFFDNDRQRIPTYAQVDKPNRWKARREESVALAFGYERYLRSFYDRGWLPPPRGVFFWERAKAEGSGGRFEYSKGKGGVRKTPRDYRPEGVSAWVKRDALVSRLRGRAQTPGPVVGMPEVPWSVEEREQLNARRQSVGKAGRANGYRAGAQEAASTKDL